MAADGSEFSVSWFLLCTCYNVMRYIPYIVMPPACIACAHEYNIKMRAWDGRI